MRGGGGGGGFKLVLETPVTLCTRMYIYVCTMYVVIQVLDVACGSAEDVALG